MSPLPDLAFWKQFVGLLFAQITVATLLAWTITRWLRNGRARQWCWRTVFVLSGCWLIASGIGVERMLRDSGAAPVPERRFVIRNNLPVEGLPAVPREVLPVVEETGAATAVTVAQTASGPVWWPAIVWAGVGILFALRAVFGQLLIAWYSRRLDGGISPELASLVGRAAERLGVGDRVLVREIPELVSPVTHGWWRVSVALPSRFEKLYTREQQELILCHELTHVASRDPLWIALSDLAAAAFWWHPMIWWARLELRRATEQTADEASAVVEGGPAALAECLVELAGRMQRPTPSGWLGVHGHDFRSGLGRRVSHLLAWRGEGWRPRPSRGQMTSMALVGMAAMVFGLFAPAMLLPRLHAEGPSLLEHMVAAIARDAEAERAADLSGSPAQPGAIEEEETRTIAAPPTHLARPESPIALEPALDAESGLADPQHMEDGSGQAATEPVAAGPDPVVGLPEAAATEGNERSPLTTEGLQSLTYAIDVRQVRQAFEELTPGDATPPDLAIALRQYLTAAGVEFGTTNALTSFGDSGRAWQSPTGRSLLFNELNGRLLIRATAAEHALAVKALDLLLPVSQQVVIEAKFIEVTEPLQMPALGFDWFLGNTLITSETNGPAPADTVTGIRTNPQIISMRGSATNTVTGIMTDPMFSGMPARAAVSELRGDELDWAGRPDPDAHRMRVEHVTENPIPRVIDSAQMNLLEQVFKQNATDLMAAPRVTTISSRLTQISVIETRSLVVGIRPEAVVGDGKAPETMAISGPFRTAAFPFGPVLEVIPTASADSTNIELDVKFSLTEFLGYGNGPGEEKIQVWDHGRKTRVLVPVSSFRIRQMNTHATLPDGQTLLMTGGTIDEPIKTKDKVPVLGDLPLLGRMFRSEHNATIQKRLFVLITATRIDPAGNPLRPVASARTPEPGLER